MKDFSRFSRDHIEQGKYIEQIFLFMGVRFIAINDHYDSNDYVGGIGEIDVAFKGILYDFFSEEQSQKVSSTLDAKRRQLENILPPLLLMDNVKVRRIA